MDAPAAMAVAIADTPEALPPMTIAMADSVRTAYRSALKQAFAAGEAQPLVVPYSMLGAFIVPTLWLAVPHVHRPWLYRTRWLVMLFVVVFDVRLILRTSSTNMAFSYAAGLMSAWAIVSNANLLLWMRPQFDSARILRRPVPAAQTGKIVSPNGTLKGTTENNTNGVATEHGLTQRKQIKTEQTSVGEYRQQSEFVWEPFPAEASFAYRLNWAIDLACSFRGAGWSHSISSIPRAKIPSEIRPGTPVDIETMRMVTANGYRRWLTEAEFTKARLRTAFLSYFALDCLAVVMTQDPYFVFGPEYHPTNLPAYLQNISPWLLAAYRQVLGLAGVTSAIAGMFSLSDLAQYHLASYVAPRCAELWLYASTFGSFSAVLDRGLTGWWGAWWHQTFRMQFLGPSAFLLRSGYIAKGTIGGGLVAVLVAFSQSGFLHACGSATTIPSTKLWRAPVFFLLQAVGIVAQQSLSATAKRLLPSMPRSVCRGANLAFSLAWLHLTADLFLDDLASTGLWLFEPVPISLLRGLQGDHWWRWDRDALPTWFSGQSWLDTGIGF